MIDTHCHILPGIDDGAKDLEESVSMAQEALRQEIELIWATPHYISGEDPPEIEVVIAKTRELENALKERAVPLQVIPAEEVLLTDQLPRLLDADKLLTVNDQKKFLLVELPFGEAPIYMEKVLFELMVKGVTPIIAHPERSLTIQKNMETAKRLASSGVLFQLNAGSLLGYFGPKVQSTAKELLKQGIVHFLGSDAHSPYGKRAMSYKKAVELVKKSYGECFTELITKENPNLAMQGLDIETKVYKFKSKSYLGGIFSLFKRAQ